MMPNVLDPYAGRPVALWTPADTDLATRRPPQTRRTSGLIDRVVRVTNRIVALFL
jgi:hypothetical protein